MVNCSLELILSKIDPLRSKHILYRHRGMALEQSIAHHSKSTSQKGAEDDVQ